MNFEQQQVSRKNDDTEKLLYARFTSNKRAMPDLIVAPATTSQPRDLLIEDIQRIEDTKDIAPFLVLLQSPRYGKTRAVLDVARTRRVVYLLCSDVNGGWSCPTVMATFVKSITTERDEDERNAIARAFLHSITLTAQKYDSPMDLFNAQFTQDGGFSFFYHKLGKTWKDSRATVTEPTKITLEDESKSLVVVFDESSVLTTEDKGTGKSAYRCIRGNLGELDIVGIFLDTFGALNIFCLIMQIQTDQLSMALERSRLQSSTITVIGQ